MTDEVKNDPLAPLRKQWEADKSPKLSLQLAEEYGRRDDFLSAITVLRTGLTQHPRHVSSRILLARFLVELEQWPEARETLEKIAAEDPTNLIANKLLVKTCLATGDRAEARNRLDLYTLLNEGDPEIEGLERALTGAGAGDGDVAGEDGEDDSPAAADGVDGSLPAPPEISISDPAPAAPAARGADPAIDGEAALEAGRSIGDGGDGGDGGDLFGIGGDGGRVASAEASSTPLAVAATRPSLRTRGGAEPFAELFDLGDRGREPEAPPPAMPGDDIFELARPQAAPPQASYDSEAAPEAEEPAAALEAARPETPRGEAPPEATVSLGRLYLQQGHRHEAERAFEAILEREPGNAAARVGLAAARGSADWVVNALDLVPRETLAAAGAEERRRAVLTGYLARLRPPATAG